MLKIKDLVKVYGKYQALNHLDLEVREGALFGFIGPNGAGKTTTMKILVGLLTADSGQIFWNDEKVSVMSKSWKEKIGYVPDSFGVYDNLKVSEYMEFFASCYGLEGLTARKRCAILLEQVGLEDKMEFYVDGLSRGMQQRLCLARALIHNPPILILDEPSSGLDPRTRYEFKETLMELQELGKTIIISSHVLSELSEFCTDIGIIDQGKIVLSGNINDTLSRVSHSNPLMISLFGNDQEKAVSLLKSHPYVKTISINGKDLAVRFTGDEQDEAQLLQRMVDADIHVRSFAREKGSLESLFIEITDNGEERTVMKFEYESDL